MQQEQKWWAKNDRLKIADTDAEHTPQVDVFKQVHIPKQLKNQVAANVTTSSPWQPTGPTLHDLQPREVFRELLKEKQIQGEELSSVFDELLALREERKLA